MPRRAGKVSGGVLHVGLLTSSASQEDERRAWLSDEIHCGQRAPEGTALASVYDTGRAPVDPHVPKGEPRSDLVDIDVADNVGPCPQSLASPTRPGTGALKR